MKKKTYIKEEAFQKVSNNKGTDIKGALNLNKEVLDTLVDKDIITTEDCCTYTLSIPRVLQADVTPEWISTRPLDSFFIQVDASGNLTNLCFVSTFGGDKDFISLYP